MTHGYIYNGFLAAVMEPWISWEGSEWGDQMRPLWEGYEMGNYALNDADLTALGHILLDNVEAIHEDIEDIREPEEVEAILKECAKVYKESFGYWQKRAKELSFKDHDETPEFEAAVEALPDFMKV
jgi:hypothetical protein